MIKGTKLEAVEKMQLYFKAYLLSLLFFPVTPMWIKHGKSFE